MIVQFNLYIWIAMKAKAITSSYYTAGSKATAFVPTRRRP